MKSVFTGIALLSLLTFESLGCSGSSDTAHEPGGGANQAYGGGNSENDLSFGGSSSSSRSSLAVSGSSMSAKGGATMRSVAASTRQSGGSGSTTSGNSTSQSMVVPTVGGAQNATSVAMGGKPDTTDSTAPGKANAGGSTERGRTSANSNATGGKSNASGGDAGATTTVGGGSPIGGATGSLGCNGNAKPATSPPNGYLTVDVKGTSRQFVLVLPTNYDGRTPQPLMFAFHGTDTSAQSFIGAGYGSVTSGAGGRMILVAPNGVGRMGGMTGWLDTGGGGDVNQADVDFFDALLAHLKANYCVDERRIFVMGHSAGGLMSDYLGCIRGNVLRGIGPFAGWGPNRNAMGSTISVKCTGKVAAMVVHNPKEGNASECSKMSGGKCPWIVDWETLGWPSVQYWTSTDSCGDIGPMPTTAFEGNSTTGSPLPCKSYSGCDPDYPVTLCLEDYADQWDGPHAFPVRWGAKAVADFFLALPKIQ